MNSSEIYADLVETLAREEEAAAVIQDLWTRFVQRRIFARLRQQLRRAELLTGPEILAAFRPAEAALLSDPTLDCRLRLRLGGEHFPPTVLFKVFTKAKVVHLSGKTLITPGSAAARSAMQLMGPQKFLELVMEDSRMPTVPRARSVVATGRAPTGHVLERRGYMRMKRVVDERAAKLGGRGNGWRPLFDSTTDGGQAWSAMFGLGHDAKDDDTEFNDDLRFLTRSVALGTSHKFSWSGGQQAAAAVAARPATAAAPRSSMRSGGVGRRELSPRALSSLGAAPSPVPSWVRDQSIVSPSPPASPASALGDVPPLALPGSPAVRKSAATGTQLEDEDELFRWAQELDFQDFDMQWESVASSAAR